MKTKRFHATLLTLVALSVLVGGPRAIGTPAYSLLSTTRVNNLEITGTTDATGLITTHAGIAMGTGGPTITTQATFPAGSAPKGSIVMDTDPASTNPLAVNVSSPTPGTDWRGIPYTQVGGLPFGSIPYTIASDGTGIEGDATNFVWRATTKRLSIGNGLNPHATLDMADSTGGNTAAMQYGAGQSAGVSDAGKGAIRFNAATNKFQTSANGAAFADIGGVGVTSVTFSGGLTATTNPIVTTGTASIATAGVTLAMMADLAQATVIGRASGAGTGVPTALTGAQLAAILSGQFVVPTASSLVMTTEAWGGSPINLSTLGTIDWWAPASTVTKNPSAMAQNELHSKRLGGWIEKSWDWYVVSSPTTTVGGVTFTSTAADDVFGGALSSATSSGWTATNTAGGFGFRFRIPVATTSRVLRVYVQTDCQAGTSTATLTGTFDDGSATSSTAIVSNALAYKVTYSGNIGTDLILSMFTVSSSGGSSGACFMVVWGASLGTS